MGATGKLKPSGYDPSKSMRAIWWFCIGKRVVLLASKSEFEFIRIYVVGEGVGVVVSCCGEWHVLFFLLFVRQTLSVKRRM